MQHSILNRANGFFPLVFGGFGLAGMINAGQVDAASQHAVTALTALDQSHDQIQAEVETAPPDAGKTSSEADAEAIPTENEQGFKLGGAFRANIIRRDWVSPYKTPEVDVDTIRLNLDYSDGPVIGSAEYRYYPYRGGQQTHFVHHAWMGYKFADQGEVQAGIQQVPFGILPYASNSWFFQLPYYVGLEDAYNLGVKYGNKWGPWSGQIAYYARPAPNGVGESEDSARYTYNVVQEGDAQNKERNTINGRLSYTAEHGPDSSTELGMSLMLGQVPNELTHRTGSRWAAAVHAKGEYGRWGTKLEAIRYQYNLKNPMGQSDDVVVMGAYDFPYEVAAKGSILAAGLSYTLPVNRWHLKDVTFYNDYSILMKDADGFLDTQQNVSGASFGLGPLFIYADLALGKQHPYMTPSFSEGLAAGGPDNGWHTRFNVNVGYYF